MQDNAFTQDRLCADVLEAELSGNLDEAASLFRMAIRCNATNAAPYLYFGHVLQLLGKSDAAVQVWSLGAVLDERLINESRTLEH